MIARTFGVRGLGIELGQCTVQQLIDGLSGLDPNLPVVIEGCDCHGNAAGVMVDGDTALIFRTDGAVFRDLDILITED